MKKLAVLAALTGAVAMSASAFAYQAVTVSNGGIISGTVKYDGKPPKPRKVRITKDKAVCGKTTHYKPGLTVSSDGGIQYAVVYLKDITKGAALKPEAKVAFDQNGCEYSPHVLAFPAGSTVRIRNDDGILHNIHTYSKANPAFNRAQPKFKKVIKVEIDKPETIKVTCDAHGWMKGWWFVAANPYYAVTDKDGRFTIKNIPAGTYTVEVWQEKLGKADQKATVKAGAETKVDFTLKR